MAKFIHVVGARPNFMKAAPVLAALREYAGVDQQLLHTGQHYDKNMSEIFFRQLGLPEPDINLEVGSGSHAVQTAQVMMRFEEVVLQERPDWVLVYGDINSTLAATLVCSKLGIPVAHVEAGLRAFDRTMPEEINRVLTDRVADLLFTPSADGDENLLKEGIPPERIKLVGNVMIDTLVRLTDQSEERWKELRNKLDIGSGYYILVTLHRPSNVDDPVMLSRILDTLAIYSQQMPIIFPIHPRTRDRIHQQGLSDLLRSFRVVDPQGYLEFLALQRHARLVITDSGGVQEETTFLRVPCLTIRKNTERPVTVTLGSNRLVGQDMQILAQEVNEVLVGSGKRGRIPPLWDGKAGERIAEILCAL